MGMSRVTSVTLLALALFASGACAANQGMAPHPPVVPRGQFQLGLKLGIEAPLTGVRNDYDCIENNRADCPARDDRSMYERASVGLGTSAPQTAPWFLAAVGLGHDVDVQAGVSPQGAEATSHWRFVSCTCFGLGLAVAPALRYSWSVSMITPLDDALALDHYRLFTATLPLDVVGQVRRGPLLFAGPVASLTYYDLGGSLSGMPLDASQGPLSGWTRRLGIHVGSAWDWKPVELRTDITFVWLRTPDSTYDGHMALIDLTLLWVH